MIFKYDQLKQFYSELKEKGEMSLFRDWKGDKVFLIRHDIDFDLKLAQNVALLENEMGVVSTFFILTTCHSYNVLSLQNRAILKNIIDLGHEIALHFDPTLYTADLDKHVATEADILSFACGKEVKSVSLHNPSIHGQYPLFEGFMNAYDPAMFSDANYISDSCFSFRGKNPFEFLDGISEQMIQILLHPIHFSEQGWGYDDIFVNTFKTYMNDIHETFLVNKTYKEQVGTDFMKQLREKLS